MKPVIFRVHGKYSQISIPVQICAECPPGFQGPISSTQVKHIIKSLLSLVSIKPISTTTTTNFEPKQNGQGKDDCSIIYNRFVFCVVVVEFAVNGNQALEEVVQAKNAVRTT